MEKLGIPKSKAIELLNTKISEFEKFLSDSNLYNFYDEVYHSAYSETKVLLFELFSQEEVEKFQTFVNPPDLSNIEQSSEKAPLFRSHIQKCIGQLKAYRYRLEHFLDTDEIGTTTGKTALPFVSMSFREKDNDVNRYFVGMLNALKIDFETGERYSWESIPEKVKNRIKNCDLVIGILTGRDETKNGKFKTSEWLVRELGIAQGAGKNFIVLAEKGVEDIAGIKSEKEIIYFERDNIGEMQKATIKFLEALREHGLV